MRQLTFLLSSLILSIPLLVSGDDKDTGQSFPYPWTAQVRDCEEQMLKNLIEITRENLRDQEELLSLIKAYKDARTQFAEDRNNKHQASVMIETGAAINTLIREKRLEHLFRQDFIKELAFFSQFDSKKECVANDA